MFDSAVDSPDPRQTPDAVHIDDGVVEAVERDQFGNARLTIKLRGGRVVNDVFVVGASQGTESGNHPVAPKVGAAGLIVFARKNHGQNRPYWVGTLPNQLQPGLYRESLEDAVWLDASRAGGAREASGNQTIWDDNGDYAYTGSGNAYRPKLRDAKGNITVAPAQRRAVKRVFEWAQTYLVRWRVGRDLVALFDAKARRIVHSVGTTAIVIEDGRIQLLADIVQVGTQPSVSRPAALADPVRTTLLAQSAEIARLKAKVNEIAEQYTQLRQDVLLGLTLHTHGGFGVPPTPPPTVSASVFIGRVVSPHDSNPNGAVAVPEIKGKANV